jgi:hypothetical protein
MSFNLLEYLKNNPLLQEELPKNKWVDLPSDQKAEYAKDIFDLINTAYAPIGGNLNYKSAADVLGAEADADYEVINIDDDPEPEALISYKDKGAGKKLTAMGHDGSKEAKSLSLNRMADLLKKPGYYLEVSGKLQDILLAKGAPVVKDQELIQKVLKGKKLEFNEDGTYQRFIGGEKHTKTLLGKPVA